MSKDENGTTPFNIALATIQACPDKECLEEVLFYLNTYRDTLDFLDSIDEAESEDENGRKKEDQES